MQNTAMGLLTVLCLFVLLALECAGRPLWSYRLEEEDWKRSDGMDDELWLLTRILEKERVEKERELSQMEIVEKERELSQMELQRRQKIEVHPRAFLERFGYLPAVPKNVSHEPTSMKRAIRHMQHMYHIRETGDIDDETLKMMEKPRCGMPDDTPDEYLSLLETKVDSVNDLKTQLKAENFYVPGYKWKKTALTWNLKNYHQLLSQEVTKNALRRAFKYWSDVSGLTFAETDSTADINMEFVWGVHSDGPQNAFDGPGGVLAHAFYPENGNTHFDSQEPWTDGKNDGINLMIVATHELGHALGLGHSDVQGALMAPYYQGYEPNFNIRDDDVRAIQTLYGGPQSSDKKTTQAPPKSNPPSKAQEKPTTPPSKAPEKPTPGPGEPPNTCDMVYKAITQTHDYRIYVYNGKWMWRTSEYGLDQGFPLTISKYYEDPPEDISAAIFSWKTYHTYFFKNKRIWKYYGFQRVEVKTVDTQGYPENPKAAIASNDKIIYLLKDGNAWKFDENKLDIITTENSVSIQTLFPGSPTNFDSVVRLVNDPHIYFFKGQNYLKYGETERKVLDGYPKPKAGPWMGPACGAKPYTPK